MTGATLFDRMTPAAAPVAAYACLCGARDEIRTPGAPAVLTCWDCGRETMRRRAA